MYESLATKRFENTHTGLAGIDPNKLKNLRSNHLRECFNLIDEMRHKLDFVARIKGITFIDDAASRTTMTTWYALETIEGNAIWIANGAAFSDRKATEMKRLGKLVDSKVKMIITLGNNELYSTVFGGMVDAVISVSDMHEAVTKALNNSSDNGKVIFSPAVENGVSYEEQGDLFKNEVNEL